MSNLFAARAQMGTSLAFHIIFAALGVGVPFMAFTAEGIGYLRKDKTWYTLARRWGKAFGILYAIGAVSGTILSFELGLLWPTFMKFSGSIIGLPFALEAFAFFTEAIFLGIYIYGWDRLPPLWHWLASIPLWVSGLLSSIFVVSANAWMNTPTGFQVQNGQVVGIDPIAAIFNPSTFTETMHMSFSAFAATGAGVAAVYAFAMLRGRRDTYNRRGLLIGMAVSLVGATLTGIFGDLNGEVVAKYQPVKFATLEGLFHTTAGAPITILGWPDAAAGKTFFGIEIPKLGSWLAFRDPNATVRGLYDFPRDLWPDVSLIPIVHLSFDAMVGIGFLAFFFGIFFWLRYRFRRQGLFENRLILWIAVALGPLSFLAIELGWMVTEMGRQPWVIQGYLRTSDAVTPAPWIGVTFFIFTLIYIALAIATVTFLLRIARTPRSADTIDERSDTSPDAARPALGEA